MSHSKYLLMYILILITFVKNKELETHLFLLCIYYPYKTGLNSYFLFHIMFFLGSVLFIFTKIRQGLIVLEDSRVSVLLIIVSWKS